MARISQADDWSAFADLFTQDATYKEHAFGEFSGREEDIYNPMNFLTMARRWAEVAERHDRLSEDGQAFLRDIRG